jgi:hypothetical protein
LKRRRSFTGGGSSAFRRAVVVSWAAVRCAGGLLVVSALAGGLCTGSAAALPLSWSGPVLVDRRGHLTEVTCPTVRFCIAVDRDGRIVTSRNPAGGRRSWSAPLRVDKNGLDGLPNALSCPSEKLCVGVDNSSDVVTSTNPMGGKRAWTAPVEIDSQAWTTGVSCPSAGVAVTAAAVGPESGGGVLVSTHPTGGRRAWSRRVVLDRLVMDKIVCPSVTLCIAADPLGFGASSTHPAGVRRAWSRLFLIDGFVALQLPSANGDDEATAPRRSTSAPSRRRGVSAAAWLGPTANEPGPGGARQLIDVAGTTSAGAPWRACRRPSVRSAAGRPVAIGGRGGFDRGGRGPAAGGSFATRLSHPAADTLTR